LKHRILPVLLCLFFSSCAALNGRDLLVPEPASADFQKTPVILIPGTTRTMLMDKRSGDIAWGILANFTGPHTEDEISLPIDNPDLRQNRDYLIPDGLLDHITIIPKLIQMQLYTRFLNTMRSHGYQIGHMSQPQPGDNFFIFQYDWRRTFDENALILARQIDSLKTFFGNPDQQFDILAHSSAVFIARYYLLYGNRDLVSEMGPGPLNRPGRKLPEPDNGGLRNIHKLLLINPAHEGLMFSFQILNEGFKPVGAPGIRTFRPAEIFTMPAFFGLLSRYDVRPFVTHSGSLPDISLYDADNWVRYGWSVFSRKEQDILEKQMKERFPLTWEAEAKKETDKRKAYLERVLDWALFIQRTINERDHPLPDKLPVYIFATEWGPTLERACFMPDEDAVLDFGPKSPCEGQLESSGDNMVTSSSLRGHYVGRQPEYIFLKEQHRNIANNKKIHRDIISILWHGQPLEESAAL